MGDIRKALRRLDPIERYTQVLPEYFTWRDFEITRSDRDECWYGDESPGGVIVRTVRGETPRECAQRLEVR